MSRLSLVTLGVRDLHRARTFYEALGWRSGAGADDDVVFFQADGIIVALWDRSRLAEDSAVGDGGGWGGVTLAYNTRSAAEVDAVVAEARAAGATIGRQPGPLLGWLLGRLLRRRRPSVGGGPQSRLGNR